MIKMVKLDGSDTYVPEEWCTITNPATSNGVSVIDDVDMPCGADCCNGDCDKCTIQKILNEYAKLTNQAE